jgi:hypothetical protein
MFVVDSDFWQWLFITRIDQMESKMDCFAILEAVTHYFLKHNLVLELPKRHTA